MEKQIKEVAESSLAEQTPMTFEKVIRNFGNGALRLKDVQRYLDAGGDVNRRGTRMNWSLL
jgi:hypothetical protein